MLLRLLKCGLGRVVAIEEQGLFALLGRRSWGGESSKQSLNDMDEEGEEPSMQSVPAPNRNGGRWDSPCERVDVPQEVKPLARLRDGRLRQSFLRL